MKKFQIVGFTQLGTLLVEQNSETFKQVTFQGFKVNSDLSLRQELVKKASISFQGSINKSTNTVRYLNSQFFKDLINRKIVSVSESQLDSSKIYSIDQKTLLKKISSQMLQQSQTKKSSENIINLIQNRKMLIQKIKLKQIIKGNLQFVTNQIVISYQQQSKTVYLPFKLKLIDHFFQLLPKQQLGPLFKKFKEIQLEVAKIYFSLDNQRYEILANTQDQFIKQILRNGWGTISTNNFHEISSNKVSEYRQSQNEAKKKQIGIYKASFEMLSLIYTKNNMVGIVQDVINGFNFSVRIHGSQQSTKIQLSSVYCPVGDEIGSYQCVQFARKQLIGKQVNVFLKKVQGLNKTGSISRVSDSKDIQQMMLQNGWAFIKQDLRTSLIQAKNVKLQQKAKQNHKGLHRKQQIGRPKMSDLTVANINHQKSHLLKRLQFFKKCNEVEEGVIETTVNQTLYIVRIQNKKTIIKLKLEGILSPRLNDFIPEYAQLKQKSKKFLYRTFNKRSVKVTIKDYQKRSNQFIGIIKLPERNGITFQQLLLQQSLVYCDNQNEVPEIFSLIQQKVQKQQKGVWQPKIEVFRPRNPLDNYKDTFQGTISWILDGEKIYIQPKQSQKQLDKIFKMLNQRPLKAIDKTKIKPGLICASQYLKDIYRARVINVKKNKVYLKFIDWGNQQVMPIDKIFQIDLDLHYIPPLCFKAYLNLVRKFRHQKCLQNLRNYLLTNMQLSFKKLPGDMVDVFRGKQYINKTLIQKGLMKMDRRKITKYELIEQLENIQNRLIGKKIGIWAYKNLKEYTSQSEEQISEVKKTL